jgi:hypothetical protein
MPTVSGSVKTFIGRAMTQEFDVRPIEVLNIDDDKVVYSKNRGYIKPNSDGSFSADFTPGTYEILGHQFTVPESEAELDIADLIDDSSGAPISSRSGIFNVKTYGAVGDGVVDDYAAIVAAITAATAGDALYLPNGTYLISQSIVINKALHVFGSGTIKEFSTATILEPMLSITTDDVELDGLTFEGRETLDTWDDSKEALRCAVKTTGARTRLRNLKVYEKTSGLRATGATDLTIENCLGENSWLSGIPLVDHTEGSFIFIDGCDGVSLKNIRADGFIQGILIGNTSTNGNVDGVLVTNPVDNGVYQSSGHAWNWTNIIAKGASNNTGIKLRGSNFSLSNATVEDCLVGVMLTPFYAVPPAGGGSDETDYSTQSGLAGAFYFNGFSIVANNVRVKNTERQGFYLGNGTSGANTTFAHDVTLTNIILRNCGQEDGYHAAQFGGEYITVDGIQIDGWSDHTNSRAIIFANPASPYLFKNNKLSNASIRRSDGTTAIHGVEFDGQQDLIVSNLTIEGATRSLLVAECQSCRFDDSKLSGIVRFLGNASDDIAFNNTPVSGWLFTTVPTNLEEGWSNNDNLLSWNSTQGNIGIATAPHSADATIPLKIRRDQNGSTQLWLQNANAGASADAGLIIDSASGGGFLKAFSVNHATVRRQDSLTAGLNSNLARMVLEGVGAGQVLDLYWGGTTRVAQFNSEGLLLGTSSFIEGSEIAEPAAPAANGFRLFAKDNGAGKTQLCVRFASGATQVLATEP